MLYRNLGRMKCVIKGLNYIFKQNMTKRLFFSANFHVMWSNLFILNHSVILAL